MNPQDGISSSKDQVPGAQTGCLFIFLAGFVIVQVILILMVSIGWWPRDDLTYCLLSLATVLISIAVIIITIIANRQAQSIMKRMGRVNLLLGGLGAASWLIYYVLSVDPSVPLAEFGYSSRFFGLLCMPLACLLFGVGGWLCTRDKPGSIPGYILFALGTVCLIFNEYIMAAYGLT